MYVPFSFAASDATGWRIAAENPFGLLLVPPEPLVAPLPFAVDSARSLLRAHVARANPVAERIDGTSMRVVFSGPHAYVTPRFYAEPTAEVPTWNYVSATASGRARVLERAELVALLDELASTFEPEDGWRPSLLSQAFADSLMDAIVGFEIQVDDMRAKLKLSQNRSAVDRRGVRAGLAERDAPNDAAVLAWMQTLTDEK